jgi:hypothetical protein
MYDAELKKMLAYVAGGLSSLTVQITLLYYVANRILSVTSIFLGLLGVVAWVAVSYFVIMTGTKYFSIKQLENELGITALMWRLYPDWNTLSKLLHRFHSQTMGVRRKQYRRLALLVDSISLCAIFLSASLLLFLELQLFAR